jgi:hypothetical protein
MALPVFSVYEGKEGTGTAVASDSVTVSGSDTIGIALLWVADSDANNAGLNWNGVAMTALNSGSNVANAGPSYMRAYYIKGPTTGTLTTTLNASRTWSLVCAVYTGGDQTTQPDNETTFSNSNTMSITSSLTPTVDECLVVMMGRSNYGTSATPSTNCTSRGEESNGTFLYDSNTTNPGTSSFSQTVTDANPAYISGFQVAIKPTSGGGGGPTFVPRVSFIM